MSDAAVFWIHSVQVETYEGKNATGDVYAAAVPVTGFLNDGEHFVRTASNEEVVSSSAFYTDTDQAAAFIPKSRVTSASGKVAHVITTNSNDGDALGLPSHLEVHLT